MIAFYCWGFCRSDLLRVDSYATHHPEAFFPLLTDHLKTYRLVPENKDSFAVILATSFEGIDQCLHEMRYVRMKKDKNLIVGIKGKKPLSSLGE